MKTVEFKFACLITSLGWRKFGSRPNNNSDK